MPSRKWKPGDLVVLKEGKQQCLVRYVGPSVPSKGKLVCGVELLGSFSRSGDHNGEFGGVRYFQCAANAGLFVTPQEIDRRVQPTDFNTPQLWKDAITDRLRAEGIDTKEDIYEDSIDVDDSVDESSREVPAESKRRRRKLHKSSSAGLPTAGGKLPSIVPIIAPSATGASMSPSIAMHSSTVGQCMHTDTHSKAKRSAIVSGLTVSTSASSIRGDMSHFSVDIDEENSSEEEEESVKTPPFITKTGVQRKLGPREIGWKETAKDKSSWQPIDYKLASAKDCEEFLKPRVSARVRLRSASEVVVGLKKAGPRDIGRTPVDESDPSFSGWKPIEYQLDAAANGEEFLTPRLSGARRSHSDGIEIVRKPGPREIGRLPADESHPLYTGWKPIDYQLDTGHSGADGFLTPRMSRRASYNHKNITTASKKKKSSAITSSSSLHEEFKGKRRRRALAKLGKSQSVGIGEKKKKMQVKTVDASEETAVVSKSAASQRSRSRCRKPKSERRLMSATPTGMSAKKKAVFVSSTPCGKSSKDYYGSGGFPDLELEETKSEWKAASGMALVRPRVASFHHTSSASTPVQSLATRARAQTHGPLLSHMSEMLSQLTPLGDNGIAVDFEFQEDDDAKKEELEDILLLRSSTFGVGSGKKKGGGKKKRGAKKRKSEELTLASMQLEASKPKRKAKASASGSGIVDGSPKRRRKAKLKATTPTLKRSSGRVVEGRKRSQSDAMAPKPTVGSGSSPSSRSGSIGSVVKSPRKRKSSKPASVKTVPKPRTEGKRKKKGTASSGESPKKKKGKKKKGAAKKSKKASASKKFKASTKEKDRLDGLQKVESKQTEDDERDTEVVSATPSAMLAVFDTQLTLEDAALGSEHCEAEMDSGKSEAVHARGGTIERLQLDFASMQDVGVDLNWDTLSQGSPSSALVDDLLMSDTEDGLFSTNL